MDCQRLTFLLLSPEWLVVCKLPHQPLTRVDGSLQSLFIGPSLFGVDLYQKKRPLHVHENRPSTGWGSEIEIFLPFVGPVLVLKPNIMEWQQDLPYCMQSLEQSLSIPTSFGSKTCWFSPRGMTGWSWPWASWLASWSSRQMHMWIYPALSTGSNSIYRSLLTK